MKKFAIALAAAASLFLSSCMTVMPGWGNEGWFFLGNHITQINGSDYISTLQDGVGAGSSKVGTAEAMFLTYPFWSCVGMIPLTNEGDITVATAAQNGGITRIGSVETKRLSFLGILVKYTTVVTGD